MLIHIIHTHVLSHIDIESHVDALVPFSFMSRGNSTPERGQSNILIYYLRPTNFFWSEQNYHSFSIVSTHIHAHTNAYNEQDNSILADGSAFSTTVSRESRRKTIMRVVFLVKVHTSTLWMPRSHRISIEFYWSYGSSFPAVYYIRIVGVRL